MMRHPLASLFSPLVLFGWFVWPDPLAFTFTGICRALFSAYALFYTSLAASGVVMSSLGKRGRGWELAGVFLFATIVSLSIGLGWQADGPFADLNSLPRQLGDALLDAVWCTVSAFLLIRFRDMQLRA